MTPKTEEIINAVNYLNEFEAKYYEPIKKEYDKLNAHADFLEPKQQLKYDKLKEQEMFLSGMVKNLRCLVELSITDEISKEKYLEEADRLQLIKDGKFRSSLVPAQTEFLLAHYNILKGELNESNN
jgi:hypothetical protein